MNEGLKAIIAEHNVDTSKAKSLTPEQHNHLITQFITLVALPNSEWPEHLTMLQVDGKVTSGKVGNSGRAKIAGKCLHGILSAATPDFCYKPSDTSDQRPSIGPKGWHQPDCMLEFFKDCKRGYYSVCGGTCYERCRRGYKDIGAACWKGFESYFKDSYWPDRMPFFDSKAQCKPKEYKWGASCHTDCQYLGEEASSLTRCAGNNACAASEALCYATIFNMAMEIGMSIASIAILGFTYGAGAPATAAGAAFLRKAGSKAVAKATVTATARAAMRAGASTFARTAVKNAMKSFSKSEIKETIATGLLENAVKSISTMYPRSYYDELTTAPDSFDPKSLDPTGLASAVDACEKNVNDVKCAPAITSAVGTLDPTGLMGVAAAFMHSTCPNGPSKELTWPQILARPTPTRRRRRCWNVGACELLQTSGKTRSPSGRVGGYGAPPYAQTCHKECNVDNADGSPKLTPPQCQDSKFCNQGTCQNFCSEWCNVVAQPLWVQATPATQKMLTTRALVTGAMVVPTQVSQFLRHRRHRHHPPQDHNMQVAKVGADK